MAEAKPFLLPGFVQILAPATVDLKATLSSDSLDTHTVQETAFLSQEDWARGKWPMNPSQGGTVFAKAVSG